MSNNLIDEVSIQETGLKLAWIEEITRRVENQPELAAHQLFYAWTQGNDTVLPRLFGVPTMNDVLNEVTLPQIGFVLREAKDHHLLGGMLCSFTDCWFEATHENRLLLMDAALAFIKKFHLVKEVEKAKEAERIRLENLATEDQERRDDI